MRARIIFPLTLSLLFNCAAMISAAPAATLDDLKLKYEVEHEHLSKPMRDLDAAFKARLQALEEKFADAGELKKVLLVREELKLVGKPGHAEAGSFAELRRLQAIYDFEAAKLVGEHGKKNRELMDRYLELLSGLTKDLTKAKKIDDAIAAAEELEKMTAERAKLQVAKSGGIAGGGMGDVSEFKWARVGDAKLIKSEGDPDSAGVESEKTRGVVYISKPLPTAFTLAGECRVSGQWAGFALGLDPRADDLLSVYSNSGRNTRLERILGGARMLLGEEDLAWKHERWVKFVLVRNSDDWSLKVGSKKIDFTVPEGISGRYFGLVSYTNSSILIRRLSLKKN